MGTQFSKYCEQSIIQAIQTAGITSATFRAYRVDDDIGEDDESIEYPICQIVSEPIQETQQGASLYSCDVMVSIATYYDDDKKRQVLDNLSDDIWNTLTTLNVDTAMGLVTGAELLGVQGLTYSEVDVNQDSNDQRTVRLFTFHLFDTFGL